MATSSSEQKAGESPAYPTSNSEDVPPDGQPRKGHVDTPHNNPVFLCLF